MEAFWSLSLAEINDIIEAKNITIEQEIKQQYIMLYELADVIANRMSLLLAEEGSVELISLREAHPEFFKIDDEEEKKQAEERARLEGARQAATRVAFAQKWNPILREKYGTTQTPSDNRVGHQGVEEGDGES